MVGHIASPFDLSHTLPVGCGLLVLCSLPGLPVIKQLMQMVTRVHGQGGRFQSVCFPKQLPIESIHIQHTSWELGQRSLSSVTSSYCAWA